MFTQQSARKHAAMQAAILLTTVLTLIASAAAAAENTAAAPDGIATSTGTPSTPTAATTDTAPNPPPAAEPTTEVVPQTTATPAPEATTTPPVSQAAAPETPITLSAQVPPQPEAASALPPLGQKHAGFAVELFFGVDKPLVAFDEDLIDFNTISGGLFLGGKIGRIIVGMGFEMSRLKTRRSGYDNPGYYPYSTESSLTTLLFKPGVRFDIVQSKDKKVDLFGKVDLGAGTIIEKEETDQYDYPPEDRKFLIVDWDAALGVRYWAHPQFAISATGGLQGSYYRVHYTADDRQYSDHLLGINAALQLLGVF